MIDIKDKKDCVGCNACVQKCPKKCIEMHEDEQGFLYPMVDVSLCINCGICEKVCPVINQADSREPLSVYAAKNKNEKTQRLSSSGGVFSALATYIIENGGVVFGARFDDNWQVIHDYAQTVVELQAFQTSKYVQSRIGDTFKQAEAFLKQGRQVLYSGTPCQLAGLRLFLRKEYENLISVDIVCHGVPSPRVWNKYLQYLFDTNESYIKQPSYAVTPLVREKNTRLGISGINFRDKRVDWEKFGIAIHFCTRTTPLTPGARYFSNKSCDKVFFESHKDNIYMKIFLKDLDLRPSCYSCPAKSGRAVSDITLADFWGIKNTLQEAYDSNGVSLVMIYSAKGEEYLNLAQVIKTTASYKDAVLGNPAIEKSAIKPKYYNLFWSLFSQDGISSASVVVRKMEPSVLKLSINLAKRILKKIIRFLNF